LNPRALQQSAVYELEWRHFHHRRHCVMVGTRGPHLRQLELALITSKQTPRERLFAHAGKEAANSMKRGAAGAQHSFNRFDGFPDHGEGFAVLNLAL
jgi:hypothetical protein